MSSNDDFSVESARRAEEYSALDWWVSDFLASDGSDNAELGRQLRHDYPVWFGPVEIPFGRLHRLAGPPDEPTLERLDEDDLDTVEGMEESIDEGWTPPPFVATWQDDHIRLEDGNHRVEGMRRSGLDKYWCIVGLRDPDHRADVEALINE